MRKYILSTLFSFVLSACGGGGGSTPQNNINLSPGIYTGTFTPNGGTPDEFAIILASNGTWAGVNPIESAYGTYSNSTLTETNFSATLTTSNSGTYTDDGINGTFSIADAGIYNRESTLPKLEGVWVDTTFTEVAGITTHVIDANGNINSSSVSGCSSTGKLNTIDTTKNEYSFSLTVSNCEGFEGVYNGLALLDDTNFTDDTLVFAGDNDTINTFILTNAVKQ